MRLEKDVRLSSGANAKVHELTVAEVRQWLEDISHEGEKGQEDAIDVIASSLFRECSLPDLARMCSLSRDQLEQLTQSDVRALIAAAKELNPDFFDLRGRLLQVGLALHTADPGTSRKAPSG